MANIVNVWDRIKIYCLNHDEPEEMDKAYRGDKDQIEQMRIQGCIDMNQYKELNNQMREMSQYYDLDDGCLKAASMNKFIEHCQELSDKFVVKKDKSLFNDITDKAKDYKDLPHTMYMDETKIPKNLKELKADVHIKKALEKAKILEKAAKKGFEEMVR